MILKVTLQNKVIHNSILIKNDYFKYIYFYKIMICFSVRTLQPRSFTKIAYNETLFEVSWLPPKDDARVNNYTVFWCLSENHRDRPYQVQYKNIFVKLKFRVLIEIPYVQLLKLSCRYHFKVVRKK